MNQALAMELPNEDPDLLISEEDNIEDMYLTFAVGGEHYGVGIGVVTEIVGMQRIMGIPDVPEFIKGVINLRGKVIPLMDVRLRFGMEERAYDERTVIIVLEISDAPLGLIVDGVREVLEIAKDKIDRTSAIGSERTSIVRGLGRIDERVAILLDEQMLASNADFSLPEELGH